MPSSSPPPDKFQREIDDIVRLAEKRLERQSSGGPWRRPPRRQGRTTPRLNVRLPSAEALAGWALVLLLLSWPLGLVSGLVHGASVLAFLFQLVGVVLLAVALVLSLTRGRGSSQKVWRGEQISYGSSYGGNLLDRLRNLFRR